MENKLEALLEKSGLISHTSTPKKEVSLYIPNLVTFKYFCILPEIAQSLNETARRLEDFFNKCDPTNLRPIIGHWSQKRFCHQ